MGISVRCHYEKMKNKLYEFLSKPYVVICVMALAPFLSYFDRNFSYFLGLFIALFLLWGSNFDWSKFGFGQKLNIRTIWRGLLLAIGIFFIINVCIEPFLEIYFGNIDLSSIEEIRGNFTSFFTLFIIMWIFAAFGEEFLFSGYYMKHLAELLGDTDKAWFVSAVVLSIYFGVSHNYQGVTGMIAIGLGSIIFFFTFYKNRTNLALLVFAHGFYDTIGLTLIYLEKDRIFYKWALDLIKN